MEKLIKKYNEECSYISKWSDKFWKLAQIIVGIVITICYLTKGDYMIAFVLLMGIILILHYFCKYIEIQNLLKKIDVEYKMKEVMLKKEVRKEVYQKLDIFQKDWITNYCKKNKINTIEKVKVIKEELKQRQNNNFIKYIDPILIGTLLLVLWEEIIIKIKEVLGFGNMIFMGILISIIISIFTGWITKEWRYQKIIINKYQKYYGEERLQELLTYRILKLNK